MTMLTTGPGYRLEYIVRHETYYWPNVRLPDMQESISIVKADLEGGCDWEFQLKQPALHVEVSDDAFQAFAELAPFFAALAAEKPTTLDQVRVILDRLGVTDATQRIDPAREPVTDNVDRPYRFSGGPWDGKTTDQPRVIVPQHCMPTTGGGEVWAHADAWPGRNRYVPDGCEGDTVVMVWRRPTAGEVHAAEVEREQRYADKHYDEER